MSKYDFKVVKNYVRPLFGYVSSKLKSKFHRDKIDARMKRYESSTTEFLLDESLPVYVRLDMRAGHSFCRGLDKPFDEDYSYAMKETTKYMVEKTGAILGYTQSDEISLVYENASKMPFGTRLFKLESVFASMCTGAFIMAGMTNKLKNKIENNIPSFDCRVLNLPDMVEAANMIFWRTADSAKNSITLLTLQHFSDRDIHGKNSQDKLDMLWSYKRVDWNKLPEGYKYGFFFRRAVYMKTLSPEDVARIPKDRLPPKSDDGEYRVMRSRIDEFELGTSPFDITNKVGVFFYREKPI